MKCNKDDILLYYFLKDSKKTCYYSMWTLEIESCALLDYQCSNSSCCYIYYFGLSSVFSRTFVGVANLFLWFFFHYYFIFIHYMLMSQDHFTKVQKMAVNMKYIGISQVVVWSLVSFLFLTGTSCEFYLTSIFFSIFINL